MRDVRRTEAGFALVLALLSLLLLTFLGLTLATTTSTELQIANNYRWSEQARYNAESGLELAKRFLQQNTAWQILVPAARPAGGLTATPSFVHNLPGPAGEDARNFENSDCDTETAVGYGVVLYEPGFLYSFQNVSTYLWPDDLGQLHALGAPADRDPERRHRRRTTSGTTAWW